MSDPVACPDCNLDVGLLCAKHYDTRIVRTETVHDSWCRVTAANRLGDAWCDCSAKERRTLGEQLRATGHVDTRAEPSFATCTLESCAPECVRGALPCPFAQGRGRKSEPRFCGHSVCGDRGGPSEACGKELPCAEHGSMLSADEIARRLQLYKEWRDKRVTPDVFSAWCGGYDAGRSR